MCHSFSLIRTLATLMKSVHFDWVKPPKRSPATFFKSNLVVCLRFVITHTHTFFKRDIKIQIVDNFVAWYLRERHPLSGYYLFFGGFTSVMRWFHEDVHTVYLRVNSQHTQTVLFFLHSRRTKCRVVCVCVIVFFLSMYRNYSEWDAVFSHFW